MNRHIHKCNENSLQGVEMTRTIIFSRLLYRSFLRFFECLTPHSNAHNAANLMTSINQSYNDVYMTLYSYSYDENEDQNEDKNRGWLIHAISTLLPDFHIQRKQEHEKGNSKK